MIKGKAKIEMGTGDVRMTGCLSNEIGALCLITQEPHAIGEKIPVEDTWSTKEAQVIFTFTKTESIDALIDELLDVKRLMNGDFPEEKRTFHDTVFDFDTFLGKDQTPYKNMDSYEIVGVKDKQAIVYQSGTIDEICENEMLDQMKHDSIDDVIRDMDCFSEFKHYAKMLTKNRGQQDEQKKLRRIF